MVLRDSPIHDIDHRRDPATGYICGCEYVLDPGNKIAHRLVGVHIDTRPLPSTSVARDSEGLQPATLPASAIVAHTEDLGTRTMQGLSARGAKTTTSYPPGTLENNDHTIVSETESWVAASLGYIAVSERTVTPDRPDSSYTLENVVVGEPKAELFLPPTDYRIVEEASDFKIVVPRTATSPAKLAPHPATAPPASPTLHFPAHASPPGPRFSPMGPASSVPRKPPFPPGAIPRAASAQNGRPAASSPVASRSKIPPPALSTISTM